MNWNYRIIRTRKDADGHYYFSIHEVFYHENNKKSWTAQPIDLGDFESVENLMGALQDMIEDVKKHPVLEEKEKTLFEVI